jgi:hypothetical protein
MPIACLIFVFFGERSRSENGRHDIHLYSIQRNDILLIDIPQYELYCDTQLIIFTVMLSVAIPSVTVTIVIIHNVISPSVIL